MHEESIGVARPLPRLGERTVKNGTLRCFDRKWGLEIAGMEELDFTC